MDIVAAMEDPRWTNSQVRPLGYGDAHEEAVKSASAEIHEKFTVHLAERKERLLNCLISHLVLWRSHSKHL